ncbi:MAG: DUF3050 domain-containing protein [Flavobacteriaceae bacterium]
MKPIQYVENELIDLRQQINQHPLYKTLETIDDIKTFMEIHVFAVWDFMSLLKALQNHLTTTCIPWTPKGHGEAARFINEIVMGEESDVNELGEAKSHYEMYLDAMDQIRADTSGIKAFLYSLSQDNDINTALEKQQIDTEICKFINFTFDVIKTQKSHCIASAFTFGREDVIPDMFLKIIQQSKTSENDNRYSKLLYYLQRHIEIDGDEHGPISLQMVETLCGNDTEKWNEVLKTAKQALEYRLMLWNHIYKSILKDKEATLIS